MIINQIKKNIGSDKDNYVVCANRKSNIFIASIYRIYQTHFMKTLTVSVFDAYSNFTYGPYDLSHKVQLESFDFDINLFIDDSIRSYYSSTSKFNQQTLRGQLNPYARGNVGYLKITFDAVYYDNTTDQQILYYLLNQSESAYYDNLLVTNNNYTEYPFYYYNDYPSYLNWQFIWATDPTLKYIEVRNSNSETSYVSNEQFTTSGCLGYPNSVDINNNDNKSGYYINNGLDFNGNIFDGYMPRFHDEEGWYVSPFDGGEFQPINIINNNANITFHKTNFKILFRGQDTYRILSIGGVELKIKTALSPDNGLIYLNTTKLCDRVDLSRPLYFTSVFNTQTGRLVIIINGDLVYNNIVNSILGAAVKTNVQPIFGFIDANIYALNHVFDMKDLVSPTKTAYNSANHIMPRDYIRLKSPNNGDYFYVNTIGRFHTCEKQSTYVKWLDEYGLLKTYEFVGFKNIGDNPTVLYTDANQYTHYHSLNFTDYSVDKFSEFKQPNHSVEISVVLNKQEYHYVKSLINSSWVQMWVGHKFAPNIESNWMNIQLETREIQYNSKKEQASLNLKFNYKQ
jgi:hypothetical protein